MECAERGAKNLPDPTARGADRGARRDRSPRGAHLFLSSVKAMLALAETEREFLISVGLSELALTDLKREVGEFEEAIEAGHAGRSDHVGASADLGVVASEVLDLVGMLDGLNRYRFRNDAELLAAWESVSKVRGPFRPHGEPDGSEGPGAGGTPDSGEVATAA